MPSLVDYIRQAREKGYSKGEIITLFKEKGYSEREINAVLSPLQASKVKTTAVSTSSANYIDKVGWLISSPNRFFTTIREPTIKDSLLLFLTVSVLATTLGMGLMYVLSAAIGGYSGFLSLFGVYELGGNIVLGTFGIAFLLGMTFAYAGIVHLTLRMMGGTGNFTDTYNACTYGTIPFIIFSLVIPFVGWLSFIYSVIVVSAGLTQYHGVSRGRSVLATLAPVILAAAAFILLLFYVVLALRSAF